MEGSQTQLKTMVADKEEICRQDGGCIHARKDTGGDIPTIQCILCKVQFHMECLNLDPTSKTPNLEAMITCPGCMEVSAKMVDLSKGIKAIQGQQNNRIKELEKRLKEKEGQCNKLTEENISLREKVAALDAQVKANIWVSYRNGNDDLLAGDSMIKDIDQTKLDRTKVHSHSGAGIDDISSDLDNLKRNTPYQTVTLMVGTNDIAANTVDMGEVVRKYKELIVKAKTIAAEVKVSSICPRKDKAQEHVGPLNAELVALCAEMENCTFVDHGPSFTLGDGTLNEGFLMGDGLHLTKSGTSKIAKNLGLRLKSGNTDCIKSPTNRGQNKGKSHVMNNGYVNNQGRHPANNTGNQRNPNWRNNRNRGPTRGRHHNGNWSINSNTQGQSNGSYQQRAGSNNQGITDSQQGGGRRRSNAAGSFNLDHLRDRDYRGRCFFCFEDGHSSHECRHGRPVMCRSCNHMGHKEKDCY